VKGKAGSLKRLIGKATRGRSLAGVYMAKGGGTGPRKFQRRTKKNEATGRERNDGDEARDERGKTLKAESGGDASTYAQRGEASLQGVVPKRYRSKKGRLTKKSGWISNNWHDDHGKATRREGGTRESCKSDILAGRLRAGMIGRNHGEDLPSVQEFHRLRSYGDKAEKGLVRFRDAKDRDGVSEEGKRWSREQRREGYK